jgi:DtxR family transcriptional regulator, Mn-dependent transcriptional regulator
MAPAERPNLRTLSEAVQDYLKAIYARQERDEVPVSTGALAEHLGVTAGSASAMIKKLAELGLAKHVPYRGVELTDEGRRVALEVVRHHRLLERFLNEELDVPWDRVHDEAEVLEHVLSEELEERIAAKLGHPAYDPHGDPIPSRDGEVRDQKTRALAELEPGDRGQLVRVSDSNPAMLRYLADRGIAPGLDVEVLRREPFDGPLTVRVGDHKLMLGGQVAGVMRVALGT